jgi:hypothetical protein
LIHALAKRVLFDALQVDHGALGPSLDRQPIDEVAVL